MRNKLLMLVALLLGGFIFYTSATGPFESLVHRSLFLALVIGLGAAGLGVGMLASLGITALGGLGGGWMGRQGMVSEYADALRERDKNKPGHGEKKVGRSAEKMQELHKNGQEPRTATPNYDASQVRQLEQSSGHNTNVAGRTV